MTWDEIHQKARNMELAKALDHDHSQCKAQTSKSRKIFVEVTMDELQRLMDERS